MIDFAVNGAAGLTGYSGGLLRYIQSGNVQRYAAVLFAASPCSWRCSRWLRRRGLAARWSGSMTGG